MYIYIYKRPNAAALFDINSTQMETVFFFLKRLRGTFETRVNVYNRRNLPRFFFSLLFFFLSIKRVGGMRRRARRSPNKSKTFHALRRRPGTGKNTLCKVCRARFNNQRIRGSIPGTFGTVCGNRRREQRNRDLLATRLRRSFTNEY